MTLGQMTQQKLRERGQMNSSIFDRNNAALYMLLNTATTKEQSGPRPEKRLPKKGRSSNSQGAGVRAKMTPDLGSPLAKLWAGAG